MLRPVKVVKVMFTKTNPADYNSPKKRVVEEVGRGSFHQWGTETQEDNCGHVFQYTVGVVEWRDGSIELVQPDRIIFLDAPEST